MATSESCPAPSPVHKERVTITDKNETAETSVESDAEETVPIHPRATRSTSHSKTYACCIAKEYYSEYANLVDTLHISPRLIIHKKSFRKNITYTLTISIRNNGLYPRQIEFSTDSPNDTTISIDKPVFNRFIETDHLINVKITIRSATGEHIDRRRHVFIHSFHPNITFQVPILVVPHLTEVYVCEHIMLPTSVPKDKTYFEMIIYNPAKDPIRVRYRNSFKGLDLIYFNQEWVPAEDYIKVLITFVPQNLQEYKGFFNVKFAMSPPRLIIFEYRPRSMSAYVNKGYLSFGLNKFTENTKRSIIICNESPHLLNVSSDFFADQSTTDISDASRPPSKLSNKMFEDAMSMHSILMFDFDEDRLSETVSYIAESRNHFRVLNLPDSLEPYSSHEVILQFKPTYDVKFPFPESADPPFFQRTKVTFCFTDADECIESHYIVLEGDIDGIEVEVYPKVIDFRKIYLGEEHCAFIKFLNVDGVIARVKYKDCPEGDTCGVRITPADGFSLEPCERGVFHLSFFSITPTRFAVTLRFKVDNGLFYKVTVKGTGQYVQLRTFPQLVEFGSVPFGVPQKRFMLLMNPLAVPITMQVTPSEDGEEQPLVLNIRDTSEMLPITVKDPIKLLQRAHEDLRDDTDSDLDFELTTDEPDAISQKSVSVAESLYSVEFEEEVMEPVPAMASHLLSNLKKQKIFDKSETDKRVIHEALLGLLNTDYFSIFKKHSNFIFMDWNAIPSDPKEIYCDNEIIYLRPNTGRSITILIIPNKLGYYHRSLTVRICPALPEPSTDSSEDQEHKTLIKSEYLCSKLWYEYNCCTPDIEWMNIVDLTERVIYAGEEYGFDMPFTNISAVGGFIHYDVIPQEMSFRDGNWKFFVASNGHIIAKCSIIFRVLSKNKLSGLMKIVGDPHPYPFHVLANVLPTEIRISPKSVHQRLQVFEQSKVHFFIDNYTPTNTKLTIRLKNEDFQYMTTLGGMLAPTKHSMYTTLISMFMDPDLYQNTIFVDLQFDHIIEIPITFLVEGVPLYFEPNIREGFDAGLLFTDPKENFIANDYTCRFPVKVMNKGLRTYRIAISRLKTYKNDIKSSACTNLPLTTRFDIVPKLIELSPKTEGQLEILISGYEEGVFACNFMLDITDTKYPQRKHVIRVTTKATFAECQLTWSRRQCTFNYQPCNPLKERPYIEIVELINPHNMSVKNVVLDVVGPFRIKGMYENVFDKQISFDMEALERRDIYILLTKAALKQLVCKQIEGRINVNALGKPHKYLLLRLNILVPELRIIHPEVVLFDRGQPFDKPIDIINCGCTTADFKWTRVEVSEHFIGDDDAVDAVADVLSEILRTLEYNFTCDEEPNLTLRYQQCRCQFHKELENGNLILDIIDEIIHDLDINQRFKLKMEDMDTTFNDSDEHSSSSFVRHTVDEIVDRLNIESSQRLSSASSEYCFSDRFIYFYEKTGQLEKLETLECMLHLPHVRPFHEVKSLFQLSVVGGSSQLLSVTLVNLLEKIKFSKDNVYLNIKPWYENYTTNIRISNVTNYPLQLWITHMGPQHSREMRFVDGYSKILQGEMLYLEPLGSDKVQLGGILGFNENFLRIFSVLINNTAYSNFRLRGQGVMPILSIISALPMVDQSTYEILEEYSFMRHIYKYEIFKSITEVDNELAGVEEAEMEYNITTDFSQLSESDEDMSDNRKHYHDYQLFKMVQTYVYVNNNEELPNGIVLNQMILTERYLQRLRANPELYAIHQKVYEEYQSFQKAMSYRQLVNAKHFTVQPLPCEQHAYILDLGQLTLNSLRRFELRLHFFGPGKLIASARTAVRIPGLYVDFSVEKHTEKKFSYWAEKCSSPEFFNKNYRNMWERLLDEDTDPKLKHAHSFDFDDFITHQRDVTDRDRRLIEEYYNSLNKSVYPDHKHHFTLAKIFTAYHSNFSGVDLRIVGLFKPESKYYRRNQRIVDYIFIDLHMGPTLPILLRGVISP